MEFSRVTARGQATIPKPIREATGLREGDPIAFEQRGDHIVMRKIEIARDSYLEGISGLMGEWASPEDEDAWRDP